MSTLEVHEAEQEEITAAYMSRLAPHDPGEAKNPRAFYVSLTWHDWPEGGSYSTAVMADDEAQAERMARMEMANACCDGDPDAEESDPLYWLEGADWHLVDCFEIALFAANHGFVPAPAA